jgi:hypothetical protein
MIWNEIKPYIGRLKITGEVGRRKIARDKSYIKKRVEIDLKSKCWLWMGKPTKDGYGQTKVNGKRWVVSRLVYKLYFGDFDKTKIVCHTCDNPRCVNPKHLFLGTQKDNMLDMVKKKRNFKRIKPTDPRIKISTKSVLEIRALTKEGKLSHGVIAEMYGITRSNVGAIHRRKSWKHL